MKTTRNQSQTSFTPQLTKRQLVKVKSALRLLSAFCLCLLVSCGKNDDDADPTDYDTLHVNKLTVTFDLNGGTGTAPDQTINEGYKATKPTAAPTRTGHAFDGWYTQKSGSGMAFDFSTLITADITLYAKWSTSTGIVTLGDTEYAGVADNTTKTIRINIGAEYKKINGEEVTFSVDNASPKQTVTLIDAKGTITGTYTSLKLFVRPTSKEELKAIIDAAIAEESNAVNLNFVDTSNITDMSELFLEKEAFNGKLSEWNTAAVTNMHSMFRGASKFNQDISDWKTGEVTNMSQMFKYAKVFDQNIDTREVDGIKYWDTSKVTNMEEMFNRAQKFNSFISNWNVTNVTNMRQMFLDAYAFNKDIMQWKTTNVTDMYYMFFTASNFDQDLSGWNVDKVTDHKDIFSRTPMKSEECKWPVAFRSASTECTQQ